jgi:signal transduction histidine kinase
LPKFRNPVRLALVQLVLAAAVVTAFVVHTLMRIGGGKVLDKSELLGDGVVALLGVVATASSSLTLRHFLAERHERMTEIDVFAGRVAHDLTSPLMAVAYGLGFLKARLADDSASAAAVNRAIRSLERVRTLMSGLREYARSGAPPDATESTSVEEILREVVDEFQLEASAGGVKLECSIQSPSLVRCPSSVLTSLAENLVRNAIKHMGEQTPRAVRVRARDSEGFVRVEVEDTGPGVPPEILPRIFEPFVRPGSGIGLSTVKRLAEAAGGRVGCRSKLNAGSLFWFELPRAG